MSASSSSTSDVLGRLADVIESRKNGDPDKSYVARLFQKGTDTVLKKVGEEATELVMAGKDMAADASEVHRKALVGEMADLWFHSMVAMAHFGLRPADVVAELARREGGRVAVRETPLRFRVDLADLVTSDGHRLNVSFCCSVIALPEAAERQMLEEALLSDRAAATAQECQGAGGEEREACRLGHWVGGSAEGVQGGEFGRGDDDALPIDALSEVLREGEEVVEIDGRGSIEVRLVPAAGLAEVL